MRVGSAICGKMPASILTSAKSLTTVVTGCRNKNRSDMKKIRPCRAAFLLKIEKEKCFYKLIHSKLPVKQVKFVALLPGRNYRDLIFIS